MTVAGVCFDDKVLALSTACISLNILFTLATGLLVGTKYPTEHSQLLSLLLCKSYTKYIVK